MAYGSFSIGAGDMNRFETLMREFEISIQLVRIIQICLIGGFTGPLKHWKTGIEKIYGILKAILVIRVDQDADLQLGKTFAQGEERDQEPTQIDQAGGGAAEAGEAGAGNPLPVGGGAVASIPATARREPKRRPIPYRRACRRASGYSCRPATQNCRRAPGTRERPRAALRPTTTSRTGGPGSGH